MRDPRVGMSGVAGGFGVLAAVFLGLLPGGLPIAVPVGAVAVMLLLNLRGGPLRLPLLVILAVVLGGLSLPLMLNGSGVVLLIGALFAVAAIFYRPPAPGAPPPGWLEERRTRSRRRRAGA